MSSVSAFAPGRVELLGNHTDYNDGVVLSAALDLGISVQGKKRDDDRIVLSSEGIEGSVTTDLTSFQASGEWSDYPLGVVKKLQEAGFPLGGFEAHYAASLPQGAGLSSSAALEVATGVFLMRLFGLSLEALEMAKLCRKAENEFVGVNCGLLDQVSSIFGKKGEAIYLDCRAESVDTFPFPENAGLLIVNSGVKHALTGGEYNERREMCFAAAEALGVKALRDATSESLAAGTMPDIVRRRAAHVVGENERVGQALTYLKAGDSAGFGSLMSASHQSSIENFENSTEELDSLVRIANSTPGVFGARLTGGGFGGAIVALVERSAINDAAKSIVERYASETGHTGTPIICLPGDGAWVAQAPAN
jgi:galactokinase